MSSHVKAAAAALLIAAPLLYGCGTAAVQGSREEIAATAAKARDTGPARIEPNADGTLPSGTGTEKAKPAAGTGNVQGRVFYNEKPAEGIEVKLSEKFNRFLGGATGQTYVAKTDSNGDYLIRNIKPGVYEGLLVKVFDSPYYQFATAGIVQSAKYRIETDRTFFAPDTHLAKSNLKLLNPKAGASIDGSGIELKWQDYPDAAYYKFSIHPQSPTGTTEFDYINKRVEGTSYALDKPLSPGSYRCLVEAYNPNDIKLAESAQDLEFRVKGQTVKP